MHKLLILALASSGYLALHAEPPASSMSQDLQDLIPSRGSLLLDTKRTYATAGQPASLQLKFRLPTSTHNDYELSLVGMLSHRAFVFQTYADTDRYLVSVGEEIPLEIPANYFYPGEPVDIRALATDGSHCFDIRVIPNRFVVMQDGYFLELRLTGPTCDTFEAIGIGFEQDDGVQFVWVYDDSVSVHRTQADSKGRASMVYSLATEGTTGGSFVLKVTCRARQVSVTFPWGDEFLQTYSRGTK